MALELKFDTKTIEHLGVRMYSTLPPALAELISNAYDADAGQVRIELYEQNGSPKAITVFDDGGGMSLQDIQEKFLVIGRNRRHIEGDRPTRKFNRLATGKKGLGKLALFGLAKEITVDTVKDGLRNRFRLDWDQLMSASGVYNPIVELENQAVNRSDGTIIQLTVLKRRTSFDLEAIADSLSRIFSVDETFHIFLDDTKGKRVQVTSARRYKNVEKQFSWVEGDLVSEGSPYFGKIKFEFLTTRMPIPPSSGMRGITIFSRGKLVNAPEYFSESTSSHFYQYLTGWIQADFVDLLDEDVISTNRQSLNWEHPEMAQFREYLSKLVSAVGQDWRAKRATSKEKEIEDVTGIDTEKWFATLPHDIRGSVAEILGCMKGSEEVSETLAPVVRALHNIVPEYPLLHWRHLHASIKSGVEEYYKNGQFGLAADQGAKLYAERLRKLSGQDCDGAKLAALFSMDCEKGVVVRHPVISINALDTDSLRNMQYGHEHLTRGLMQGFRNPVNHAPIGSVVPSLISELDCLNVLSLISYLAGKVDFAESRTSAR